MNDLACLRMNIQIKSIIPKMNIMKKISLALALCCASFYSMADQLPLGGFSYGPVEAPTGKEWESPENLALNKEQPHAYIFPFQDVESARKVLPENSKFWQSLDGDWKFNWAPDPDSRPTSIRRSLMYPAGIISRFLPVGIFMESRKTVA